LRELDPCIRAFSFPVLEGVDAGERLASHIERQLIQFG
jgi:hypothetical protein